MPSNGLSPNTGWASVTISAAALSATSIPIPVGVQLVAGTAFSIGLSASITHEAAAVTDGFPIPANTIFTVPPAFFPGGTTPDLMNLFAIAGGTVNVWLLYPRG